MRLICANVFSLWGEGNLRERLWADPRNIRSSEYGDLAALDLLHHRFALQIEQTLHIDLLAGGNVLGIAAGRVEPAIMIAGDHDLERMRLQRKPVDLLLDVGDGAGIGEITGVYEDVADRDRDSLVVGVGDADHLDGLSVAGCSEGMTAQDEDDSVEDDGEVRQRRCEQVVDQRLSLPLIASAKAEPL